MMPLLTVVPSRCNGVTLAVERRFKNKNAFVSPIFRGISISKHIENIKTCINIYMIYIYIFIYESAYVFLFKKTQVKKLPDFYFYMFI